MFRWLICFFGLMIALPGQAFAADSDRREFTIIDFRLQNEIVLPSAKLTYATHGTLN